MKKLFITLLIVLSLFALVSCSSSKNKIYGSVQFGDIHADFRDCVVMGDWAQWLTVTFSEEELKSLEAIAAGESDLWGIEIATDSLGKTFTDSKPAKEERRFSIYAGPQEMYSHFQSNCPSDYFYLACETVTVTSSVERKGGKVVSLKLSVNGVLTDGTTYSIQYDGPVKYLNYFEEPDED